MKGNDRFDHRAVDAKWHERWLADKRYATPKSTKANKAYILDMFPYPSGEGLHVGHPMGYIGTDIVARYLRAKGKAVLHPMGFDSFGLPAENYAIKTGVHPAETTKKAIVRYREQLQMIGLSYDWDREIATSDPTYYRWTQWLFLKLYEKGLAYRAKAPVNWCPHCQTVLANEQVKDGKCERCDTPVVQKQLEQWFFKITAYADELLADVEKLNWPEPIKIMQRNWIGRSEGALLRFELKTQNSKLKTDGIEVFTTRPDTLFGATYLVLSPEHWFVTEQVKNQKSKVKNIEDVKKYVERAQTKTELERQSEDSKEKTGVELKGVRAINPATKEEIPIWVADYVLGSYGTGAIMAVPAHDERDFAFAKKFKLPMKQVIAPHLVDQDNPPRKGKRHAPRVVVQGVVRHWKDNTVLQIVWKKFPWKTFVIGGAEQGEDLEDAVKREVHEETGFKNFKSIRKLGWEMRSEWYADHKDENRYAHMHVFELVLADGERDELSQEEQEKHTIAWVPFEKIPTAYGPVGELGHIWQALREEPRPFIGSGLMVNSGNFSEVPSDQAKKKITESVGGQLKTTYRLRDWLVSRQRYWGAPIPMLICKEHGYQPIPEDQLPVLLPTDVDFKPTGQSPLVDSKTFHAGVTCPTCGQPARREVDTIDTFVDSSWYFLRFTDPHNNKVAFDPARVQEWLPVDWYVGGAEHAVLHLLYARFFTKALADIQLVNFREPFPRLRNQGMIGGEDGRKMSKRWGNVVNPDDVVRDYGADALRAFEMFMGPFEDAKPWSTKGIVGVRRWLDRVWKLQMRMTKNEVRMTNEGERILNQTIQKVTNDIENFHFNTAVSQLMILTNALEKEQTLPKAVWQTFLQLTAPIIPHISHELWERAGLPGRPDGAWPTADQKVLASQTVRIAIQVNGKLRGQMNVPADILEGELQTRAEQVESVAKHLAGKKIQKTIIIPGRIINFVVS